MRAQCDTRSLQQATASVLHICGASNHFQEQERSILRGKAPIEKQELSEPGWFTVRWACQETVQHPRWPRTKQAPHMSAQRLPMVKTTSLPCLLSMRSIAHRANHCFRDFLTLFTECCFTVRSFYFLRYRVCVHIRLLQGYTCFIELQCQEALLHEQQTMSTTTGLADRRGFHPLRHCCSKQTDCCRPLLVQNGMLQSHPSTFRNPKSFEKPNSG